MITLKEFQKADEKLENKIIDFAEESRLTNDNVAPILDGIVSAEKYLSCNPKIMWILKAPYDDFTKEGEPYGGEWSITKDVMLNPDRISGKTFIPMVYATYGILNKTNWEKQEYYDEISDVLQNIAFINVSKMPSYTREKKAIQSRYNLWKSILLEQIKTYNPDIMIFGYTFYLFKEDLLGGNECKERVYYNANKDRIVCNAYYYKDKLLIDAYHPSQTQFKQEIYVDNIIKAYMDWDKNRSK